MEILFLGTGTSTGIPQIGCECEVCRSVNLKDKRLRASVLVVSGKTQLLIDCGPDFRQQILTHHINRLSGVLLTHEHYDHVGGLDDIRPLGNSDIYAEDRVMKAIKRTMPYCFSENKYPGVPLIHLHEINENAFEIDDLKIQPIRIMHYKLPILGFRIGNMAYLTDVKTIDESCFEELKNLDTLILSALRPNFHFAHLSLNEALALTERIGARKTFFTHMSHDMGFHDEINRSLTDNVQLAFDGLRIIL